VTTLAAPAPLEVPYGYCLCGCGELAPLAPVTVTARGWIKGAPLRYVHGHRCRLSHVSGPRRDAIDKFWERTLPVDGPLPTPCLIWQGGLWPNGYAKTSISGRTRLGHRLAYELAIDTRLTSKQVVAHHCDTPACLSPRHLFLTDAKGNAMDSASKGRARKVLVAGQAMEMRCLHATGWSTAALAEKFLVGRSTVYRVISGRGWQHLLGDWVPAPRHATSGERHPNAKLNPLKAKEIRHLRQSGEKLEILARQFGVTPQTISSIAKDKTWRVAEAAA
jgi:hypothetical protein